MSKKRVRKGAPTTASRQAQQPIMKPKPSVPEMAENARDKLKLLKNKRNDISSIEMDEVLNLPKNVHKNKNIC